MIGQLVQLPVDKCLGVIIGIYACATGAMYTVLPVEDSILHIKGDSVSVPGHYTIAVEHRIEKVKK